MRRLSYAVLTLLSSASIVSAQNTRITGTVLSAEDGEPIIGASIIVKGTTTGTVTLHRYALARGSDQTYSAGAANGGHAEPR